MVTKAMSRVAANLEVVRDAAAQHAPGIGSGSSPSPRVLLSHTIATEIVPRLLLVHRPALTPEEARRLPVQEGDITALAAALLANDDGGAEEAVEAARTRGATLEHVALDLMAPAARQLGAMWAEDDCSYTDVTLGVWRLQRILRDLSPLFQPHSDNIRGSARRALISVLPGEDHSFGTDMVAGFLRLAGWEVWNEAVGTAAELARQVRRDPARIIGLSCACGEEVAALATLVTVVRRAAPRPVAVMVGGRVFTDAPRRALRVGADAVAHDARHAVRQAEGLLHLLDPGH